MEIVLTHLLLGRIGIFLLVDTPKERTIPVIWLRLGSSDWRKAEIAHLQKEGES